MTKTLTDIGDVIALAIAGVVMMGAGAAIYHFFSGGGSC